MTAEEREKKGAGGVRRHDDPDALAAAVCRLLEDAALGARLAATGRDRVLTTFTEEQDAHAWLSVLAAPRVPAAA